MTHPQPHAIPPFEGVPDEVLHDIFMHIATDYPVREGLFKYGPHPLLPVAQVNRRFNAVASPLLVRKWHLTTTGQGGAKFVLHLLKHHHLRSQVKSLALDVRMFDREPVPREPTHDVLDNCWLRGHISAAEVEQLVESAEETCPPLARLRYHDPRISWTDQIGQRSTGAISALVLAWATELQELDLLLRMGSLDSPEYPDPWLIRLVKLAVGVLPAFEDQIHELPPPALFDKLRSVTLVHFGTDPGMEGVQAAAFFRLPGLRVFKAYGMDASGLTLDEADPSGSGTALQPPADRLFPNGTSHVEELHLYLAHISENGLRVLTRACKRLRMLVLEWGNFLINPIDFDFSGNAIADAIKLHSASLEEISINSHDITTDVWKEFTGDVDPEILGGCLLQCDKLKRLTIDLEVLYGGSDVFEENSCNYPLLKVLPQDLTSLGLNFVQLEVEAEATKDNVLGLLRHCGPNGRFSRLKKLQLTDYITDYDEEHDITFLAGEAGVEFILHTRQDGDW